MSDFFHEKFSTEVIFRLLGIMVQTPHFFLILTKRARRMVEVMHSWLAQAKMMPSNIGLGVTVETAEQGIRLYYLASVHTCFFKFVSLEPLLGPLSLRNIAINNSTLALPSPPPPMNALSFLDWVIVGGETGYGARPMEADWAYQILKECQAMGIPFFFKQMSQGKETPADLNIREWPERLLPYVKPPRKPEQLKLL